MTFETDERASGSGSASEASSLMLRRMPKYLWLRTTRADVEASGRGVRKRMIEDVQRPLVLVENELEAIVVRGIGDGNRHQIRRSTPEEPDRDSVALAGRQFRPPRFVCRFEHLVIPSQ